MIASLGLAVSVYAAECAGIPGADRLWRDPRIHYILIGEMHGTNEAPAIFGDLVCAAASNGRAVVAGLERSSEEQDAIDLFVNSPKHEAAAQALLSRTSWGSRDGRSSRAMLALLEKLRALKLEGKISEIVAFAFDDSRSGDSPAKSEERMASALMAAAGRHPEALVIALTGNVHASKKPFAEMGSYPLMAMFLPPAETLSLYVADRGGEAWNCQSDVCKPHPFGSSGGLNRGVILSRGEGPSAGYLRVFGQPRPFPQSCRCPVDRESRLR